METLKRLSLKLRAKKLILFLDYDGTLTPIVWSPEAALLSKEMKTLVEKAAKRYTLAIISGRARGEVERLVGIKGIIYAGDHGMDISGPAFSMLHPRGKEFMPLISSITAQLEKEFKDVPGVLIQAKNFSVSLHYRLAAEKYLPRIKDKVEQIAGRNKNLRLMAGKKVWEIMPKIDWDKGKAVNWIMQVLKLSWTENLVVYIGDDTTDEDAFKVVGPRGVAVLVSDKPQKSAAEFRLASVDEVKELFRGILQ